MDSDNLIINGVFGFLAVFLLGLFVTVCLAITDSIQERRAFPAFVACEQRQMLGRRNSLSAKVVCVPAIQRQDTTTVRVTR